MPLFPKAATEAWLKKWMFQKAYVEYERMSALLLMQQFDKSLPGVVFERHWRSVENHNLQLWQRVDMNKSPWFSANVSTLLLGFGKTEVLPFKDEPDWVTTTHRTCGGVLERVEQSMDEFRHMYAKKLNTDPNKLTYSYE